MANIDHQIEVILLDPKGIIVDSFTGAPADAAACAAQFILLQGGDAETGGLPGEIKFNPIPKAA